MTNARSHAPAVRQPQPSVPREVLEEALDLLGAYRLAPKFGRDRTELQPILDLEDEIDAFLARHGRFASPSQPRQETGHD